MSIFPKNPNERAFAGGKKHWAEVIKNSGPGDLLIWRQPEEDFNVNSTLIVMPGEEAVFIKGGNVEQVFENGTYQLKTENYPFISRLRNAMTGGISTFNCVVYFIRKAHTAEILWGTSSPIQVRDPVMMLSTSVRARGAYKIQVENGARLLTKLIGNNIAYLTPEQLPDYFDNEFQQYIKSSIAKAIKNANQEILGICAEQDELAKNVQSILQEPLNDYGLRLITFSIAGIDIPENDPNRQKLEKAFADKGVMNILGSDWGRQQATEILHNLSENPGSGGIASAGAGFTMGTAAGTILGGMAQQMFEPMQQPVPPSPVPSQAAPEAKEPEKESAPPSVADELIKLKGLLDAGVLDQDEFNAMKKKLLGL